MKKNKYSKPGRPKIVKFYIISSTVCKSADSALEMIREWDIQGNLDSNCTVFEITEKTKVFRPVIKLEEIK